MPNGFYFSRRCNAKEAKIHKIHRIFSVREFLKTSAKFGTMASAASLSSFALSACDSKTDSKSTNGAQNQGAKNVESQT